jgi:hypothetical protein
MIASTSTDLVYAVAGYGLPKAAPALPQDVNDETWDAMLVAVIRERVTGQLVQAIHESDFPASEDQQAACVDAHEGALALAILLERLLLPKVAQLDAVKVPTKVLRGPGRTRRVSRAQPSVDLEAMQGLEADPLPEASIEAWPRPRIPPSRAASSTERLSPARSGSRSTPTRSSRAARRSRSGAMRYTGSTRKPGSSMPASTLHSGARNRACSRCVTWRRWPCVLRSTSQGTNAVPRVALRHRRATCGRSGLGRVHVRCHTRDRPMGLYVRDHEVRAAGLAGVVAEDRSYALQAVAGLQALQRFRDQTAYAATLVLPTRWYVRAREGNYLRRGRRAVRLLLDDHSARPQASESRAGDGRLA